jgi:hypothetical protein
MEPVRSDDDNFRDYLAHVLTQHDTTMTAVRAAITKSTRFPKATSLDQLASISSGRRKPNPQAVVEIADALNARDEFPDYDLCLLRSLLDPKIVGAEGALELAGKLAPLVKKAPLTDPTLLEVLEAAADRQDAQKRAPSSSTPKPRRREDREP